MRSLAITCPSCRQEPQVEAEAIRLVLVLAPVVTNEGAFTDQMQGQRDFFEWICPACQAVTRREATHQHLRMLLLAGVVPTMCFGGANSDQCTCRGAAATDPQSIEAATGNPTEAGERPEGPPLTEDDVLDFVLAAQATPFLVLERRVGRPFTSDDQLALHIALSRSDYLGPVFEYYGSSGVLRGLSS